MTRAISLVRAGISNERLKCSKHHTTRMRRIRDILFFPVRVTQRSLPKGVPAAARRNFHGRLSQRDNTRFLIFHALYLVAGNFSNSKDDQANGKMVDLPK